MEDMVERRAQEIAETKFEQMMRQQKGSGGSASSGFQEAPLGKRSLGSASTGALPSAPLVAPPAGDPMPAGEVERLRRLQVYGSYADKGPEVRRQFDAQLREQRAKAESLRHVGGSSPKSQGPPGRWDSRSRSEDRRGAKGRWNKITPSPSPDRGSASPMGSEDRLGAPGGSSPPTPARLAVEPSPCAKVTRDAAERLRQMENFVARHRGVDRQQSMLTYEARRAAWMEGLARQARLQKALTNPTEIKEKKILSGDVPIKLFTMGLAHAWPKQLHRGDPTIGHDRHRTLQAVLQHQRFNESHLADLNLVYGPRRIIFLNCERHFTNICQRDGRHLGFHPDLTKRLLSQTRGLKIFLKTFGAR